MRSVCSTGRSQPVAPRARWYVIEGELAREVTRLHDQVDQQDRIQVQPKSNRAIDENTQSTEAGAADSSIELNIIYTLDRLLRTNL